MISDTMLVLLSSESLSPPALKERFSNDLRVSPVPFERAGGRIPVVDWMTFSGREAETFGWRSTYSVWKAPAKAMNKVESIARILHWRVQQTPRNFIVDYTL
mmetsp:Transcript_7002/g.14906  ORF Transcript_7002/g.14906 Transcript_7002/m.14906 type:complete len:102 (+) Transcript_7002:1100-1405(+)